MFTTEPPMFNDVYEYVGAAIHYIEEAGYNLKALSMKLNIDLEQ